MSKRIYVKNLPTSITRTQVKELFSKYGTVSDVTLSRDGTAYVEMSDGADDAINFLDKTEMGGRTLNVNEAITRR